MNKKWKILIAEINSLKQKAVQTKHQEKSKDSSAFERLNQKINEHNQWLLKCDQIIGNKEIDSDQEKVNVIAEMTELENDLPYRQTMFETDFKKYSSKLKTNSENDTANQYYESIMSQYSKVIVFFSFIFASIN